MKFKIFNFAKSIWSYNRSLSGEGNRATLKKIKSVVKLKLKNIKSGTKCFVGIFLKNGTSKTYIVI